jgi:tetratricopeptide (TPR) repeat protein
MSFNTNAPSEKQQSTELTSAAIKYLRQGWNAQAFLLLSEAEIEKDPAAKFALGLCHIRINDPSAAITCFEQALDLLKASSSSSSAPITRGPAESSETYIKLAAAQIEEKAYLTPMDTDFCTRFPKAAEQNVLLALIYAYHQKGMFEQVQRLSSGLTGPVFEAYKKKLAGNSK